jgi:hypothetical protein
VQQGHSDGLRDCLRERNKETYNQVDAVCVGEQVIVRSYLKLEVLGEWVSRRQHCQPRKTGSVLLQATK